MSQQYPQQPQWGQPHDPTQPGYGFPPQPGEPGYGHPQQPDHGHPQQPGWGAPPPQPPKRGVGKIIGIVAAVFVGLIVIVAVAGGGKDGGGDAKSETSSSPAAVNKDDAEPAAEEEPAGSEPSAEAPVKITATKTAFTKGVLAENGDYTSVKVTVTNNSDAEISVNPLYFAITDTDGTKHTSELAADQNQIDSVQLAPGENITGVITGEGKFTPKSVTYTEGWLADPIRVDVS